MTDLEWMQFTTRFGDLSRDTRSAALLREHAVVRRVPANEILYHDGDECGFLPMVLSGEVSLSKHAETGRSIVLYRIGGGESCILSTVSILTERAFPAEALTEVPATVVLVPAAIVRSLIDADPAWRRFAFSVYHDRLAGLIELVEEVVFARLDVRLAEYLLERTREGDDTLSRTHQAIASDLGSTREVVSRLLKEWERRGGVSLGRGRITVVDPDVLGRLAGG